MVATLLLASLLPVATAAPHPIFLGTDDTVEVVDADNDAFVAAESVVVSERIGDNAFLAGQTIRIEAPVDGDLFSASETLRIDAPVHGDVFAVGETIELGPEGRIDGHLWTAGATIEVSGPVFGDVRVGAGELIVNAPIHGDVEAEVGALTFDDGGVVRGDLAYRSPSVSDDAEAATEGTVSWTKATDEDGAHIGSPHEHDSGAGMWTLWTGWRIIGQLIVGAVLLMLGGRTTAAFGEALDARPSESLGLGLVGMVVLPIASVLACLMVLPLPLGMLGLALFGILLYVGQLVAAQALGARLLRRFGPEVNGTPLLHLLVGVVPLAILTGLPFLGGLVGFLVTVLGAGAIGLHLRAVTRA